MTEPTFTQQQTALTNTVLRNAPALIASGSTAVLAGLRALALIDAASTVDDIAAIDLRSMLGKPTAAGQRAVTPLPNPRQQLNDAFAVAIAAVIVEMQSSSPPSSNPIDVMITTALIELKTAAVSTDSLVTSLVSEYITRASLATPLNKD